MKIIPMLALAALCSVALQSAHAAVRAGDTFTAVVTTFKDGDSFTANTSYKEGVEIRLWGVDAPEGRQSCGDARGAQYACGRDAAALKRSLTQGQTLNCTVVTPADSYKRVIARCLVNGADLAETMVRAGHALDWERYSKGHYRSAQAEAQRAKRGVWQGSFQSPWDYRSSQRR